MPAFMFEKISSPVRRTSITPAAKKPRGMISQMIDRLVESRVKRSPRGEHRVRRQDKSAG